MTAGLLVAVLALAIWIYLIAWRGDFWRASVRDTADAVAEPTSFSRVIAIVPARNEADMIAKNVRSLLSQDYPGDFRVVLVDDQSQDATAAQALKAAEDVKAQDRLTVIPGTALPPNWTGKVWAMKQGVDWTDGLPEHPRYLLFTDADIVYQPAALRGLVARAEARSLVMTSLMVKLHCETFAERALIPAFVFFFQMLYPFSWVNRSDHRMAAAAGGCMLVRHSALLAAGGIEAIHDALIDDCALARRLKAVGSIWLALTERVQSMRVYPSVSDIRRMVSRSAYDQLGYSPLLLVATVAAMALIYVTPVFFTLFGTGLSRLLGASAWILMAVAFQPILRLYRLSPLWGLALPAIAFAYMLFTLDSAYQHVRGRGGLWKGRTQARASRIT